MKNRYPVLIAVIVLLTAALSSCFLFQKPLTAPKPISPANGATDVSTTVTLSWAPSDTNANYEVLFGTDRTALSTKQATSTYLAEKNLAYSTTYYWEVEASANRKTATSSVFSFTTIGIPNPSTPILSVTSKSTDSVSLGWTKSDYASSVEIYEAASGSFKEYASLAGTSVSYTVQNLSPSTMYEFLAVAVNASGRATSNTVSAMTGSNPILPAVDSFSVTSVSTDTATLGWKTSNASEVYVYSSPSNSLLAEVTDGSTSYTVNNLTPSTSYRYFISAANPSGRATSDTVTATTLSYAQTTRFTVYIGDKPVSRASIQHLYVNLTGFSVHATYDGTSAWYTSSASGTYDLTTLVGTFAGVADISVPSSAIVTQIRFDISAATIVVNGRSYALGIPSSTVYLNTQSLNAGILESAYLDFDLSTSVEETGSGYTFKPVIHTVGGNARASVTGYVVYKSKPVSNATVSIESSSTVVAQTYTNQNGRFTIGAVTAGDYTMVVDANATGISGYSTTVSLSKGNNDVGTINLSLLPPAKPVLNLSSNNPHIVLLNWTSCTGADGYRVWESSTSTNAMIEIAELPSTAASYDATVKPGVAHEFAVSSFNQAGQTWSSEESTKTTLVLGISSLIMTDSATVSGKIPFVAIAVIEHNVPNLEAATATIGTVSVGAQNLSASPTVFLFNGSLASENSGSYAPVFTITDSEGDSTGVTAATRVYVDNKAPTISLALSGTYFSPDGTPVYFSDTVSSTSSTSVDIYYGSSTPTICATVADNSGYHVTVYATYGESAVSVSGNGTDKATFDKTLTSGKNILTINATDAYGHEDTFTLTITATQNTAVPSVKITTPATIGIPTTQSSTDATVSVNATVGNAAGRNEISSVKVNGVSASRESANLWTAKIPLAAGSNAITVTATDIFGNSTTKSTSIYVDNKAPAISLELSGTYYSPDGTPVTFSDTVSSTSSTSVDLYYGSSAPTICATVTDGSGYHVTVSATYGESAVSVSGNGGNKVTFGKTLASGTNVLTVNATDAYGHEDTLTVTFAATQNTAAPSVKVTAPASLVIIGSSTDVAVTVTATVGNPEGGNGISSVKVNGVAAEWESANDWVATVTLNTGTDTVVATAVDLYGNTGSSSASVYVKPKYAVVATIAVGVDPYGVGINPNTNKIYVANQNSNTVSVIDGTTNTVTTAITVGSGPAGVGVDPVTNMIYVANNNDNTVSVIDSTTNTVATTIILGSGPGPIGIGVDASTDEIYTANYPYNTVSVINGTTNTVATTITVGSYPDSVGVNPITNTIYVANSSGNTVSVIDGTTNTLASTIPVGNNPMGIGIDASTDKIYVVNYSDNTVSVIDGTTNTLATTIPVGSLPESVGVNPITNTIYVANSNDNTVSVIDGATNTVIKTISVGTCPWGVGVDASTDKIYVANKNDNTVSVIKVN